MQRPPWTPQAPGSEGVQQTPPWPLLDAPGVDKGASLPLETSCRGVFPPRRGNRVLPPLSSNPSSTDALKTVALGPPSKCSDCLMSVLELYRSLA